MLIELLASVRRIARAFASRGCFWESFEITASPLENAMTHAVYNRLHELMGRGLFRLLWVGLNCDSWSAARRGPSDVAPGISWPPRLRRRGSSEILGLDDLSVADQARVKKGNKQALWMARLFRLAAKFNCAIVLENPLASMLWSCTHIDRLMNSREVSRFRYFARSCCSPLLVKARRLFVDWPVTCLLVRDKRKGSPHSSRLALSSRARCRRRRCSAPAALPQLAAAAAAQH